MSEEPTSDKPELYVHLSAKIPVPAFGGTLSLRLLKPDLVEDGRQHHGETYISTGKTPMCTVDQAEEWIAALETLVRMARGEAQGPPVTGE